LNKFFSVKYICKSNKLFIFILHNYWQPYAPSHHDGSTPSQKQLTKNPHSSLHEPPIHSQVVGIGVGVGVGAGVGVAVGAGVGVAVGAGVGVNVGVAVGVGQLHGLLIAPAILV
jgi:hypothetical protein